MRQWASETRWAGNSSVGDCVFGVKGVVTHWAWYPVPRPKCRMMSGWAALEVMRPLGLRRQPRTG